jgi:hypothetical protein
MVTTRGAAKVETDAATGATAPVSKPRSSRSKGPKAPDPQLPDAAFTPGGHALRFNWPGRILNRTIIAHEKLSSTPYKTVTATKDTDEAAGLYRQTFEFTKEEIASDAGAGEVKVVIVGMTMKMDFWDNEKAKVKKEKVKKENDKKDQEETRAQAQATKGAPKPVKKQGGIVGQYLPTDTDHIFRLPERYTGHRVQTEDLDAIDLIDGVEPKQEDEDVVTLLVVTPCTSKKGQTKLYVLMKPEGGLCRGFNCPGDEVFYFPEFRDFEKAVESRPRRWNALVQKISVASTAQEDEALTAYAAIRDKTTVVVDPTVAFANEVAMLTGALSVKQDPWLMKKLKATLDEAVPPLLEYVREYPQIKAFLVTDALPSTEDLDATDQLDDDGKGEDDEGEGEGEEKPGEGEDEDEDTAMQDTSSVAEEDVSDENQEVEEEEKTLVWSAEEMLEEVKQRWPATARQLDAGAESSLMVLHVLRNGILDNEGLSIAADEVEPMLRVAPTMMDPKVSDEDFVVAVLQTVRNARCNVVADGESLSRSSIDAGSYPALLAAVVDALKKVRAENKGQADALHKKLGNDVVPKSPAEVWQLFGDTPTTDAARKLFDSFSKFLVDYHAGTADIIGPQLSHIIEVAEIATGKKAKTAAKKKPATAAKKPAVDAKKPAAAAKKPAPKKKPAAKAKVSEQGKGKQ